jgi:hypothetical protein
VTQRQGITEVLSGRMPSNKVAAFKTWAASQGREPAEQLEWIVTEALIAAGLLSPEEVALHRLRESLIRRFLDKATEIYKAAPRKDITAETARQLAQESSWAADYQQYTANRDRRTINPTFGRRVKLLLKLETGQVYTVPQPHIFASSSYLLAP